jgi:large conductance mechanosensitive channel
MLAEFREFLLKTNALALAIGVVIGTALGAVVNSLVNDIIMPPIGYVLGGLDFSNLTIKISDSVSIHYGAFLNTVIAFIVIAFVVFWISRVFLKPEPAAEVKTCPFCKESNNPEATRCKACTSEI